MRSNEERLRAYVDTYEDNDVAMEHYNTQRLIHESRNPTEKPMKMDTVFLMVHSQMRMPGSHTNSYKVPLSTKIDNIVEAQIVSFSMQSHPDLINKYNDKFRMSISSLDPIEVQLTHGRYNGPELATEIQKKLTYALHFSSFEFKAKFNSIDQKFYFWVLKNSKPIPFYLNIRRHRETASRRDRTDDCFEILGFTQQKLANFFENKVDMFSVCSNFDTPFSKTEASFARSFDHDLYNCIYGDRKANLVGDNVVGISISDLNTRDNVSVSIPPGSDLVVTPCMGYIYIPLNGSNAVQYDNNNGFGSLKKYEKPVTMNSIQVSLLNIYGEPFDTGDFDHCMMLKLVRKIPI